MDISIHFSTQVLSFVFKRPLFGGSKKILVHGNRMKLLDEPFRAGDRGTSFERSINVFVINLPRMTMPVRCTQRSSSVVGGKLRSAVGAALRAHPVPDKCPDGFGKKGTHFFPKKVH